MKIDSPTTFPTSVVLGFVVFVLSWMTELLLLVTHAVAGRLPGNNPVAHCILLAVALGSSLFACFVGRRHFARDVHPGGCMHINLMQSIIVTIFIVGYAIFLEWAFGLFV